MSLVKKWIAKTLLEKNRALGKMTGAKEGVVETWKIEIKKCERALEDKDTKVLLKKFRRSKKIWEKILRPYNSSEYVDLLEGQDLEDFQFFEKCNMACGKIVSGLENNWTNEESILEYKQLLEQSVREMQDKKEGSK